MQILGLVTRTHDSGLALLKDGIPHLVLEEERFNREKHTRRFPFRSMEVAFATRALDEIDVITTPWSMPDIRRTFAGAVLARLPASLNLLRPSANPAQSNLIVTMPVGLRYGLWWQFGLLAKLPSIVQVRHHDAHAAMFFVSPFEEAAVLVTDGYGDDAAQSAYVGQDNHLERLWHGNFFDSLGMLYTAVTMHLGFKMFEEGTVMALAASGGPTYVRRFADLIHLKPDGQFAVNRDYVCYDRFGLNKPLQKKFTEVFGPARRADEPILDRHRDLAFALQANLEEAMLHVVRDLSNRHRSRNLVLAGGVALNCVANSRVLQDTDYDSIWIPPCPSDSGAPLGSALWHHHQTLGHARQLELSHAYYGKGYSEEEIVRAMEGAGLSYQRLSDAELLPCVARKLADGRIIGWFQGRAEVGPRALGNRSILADARDPEIKDRINKQVKHRQPFRPFAPAVLEERLSDYFEMTHKGPFMTFAPRVRPDKEWVIPACVHVDGTARVQTVNREMNPLFHRLIRAFDTLTGVPVVLNTSFNVREPIVQRPEDAVSCYLRTSMDALVIGNFYSERAEAGAEQPPRPMKEIAAA